jgi:hypothetical protein
VKRIAGIIMYVIFSFFWPIIDGNGYPARKQGQFNMTQVPAKLDNLWQNLIEVYFENFMEFFFPQIHKLIDWNRSREFLEKERQSLVRGAHLKRTCAEKLVTVRLFNRHTTKFCIYINVQLQKDELFAQRMFINNSRLFDHYGTQVMSLAILADSDLNWRPKSYSHHLIGFDLSCHFPIVKLIDYLEKEAVLKKSNNPFAMVVRVYLVKIETQNNSSKRLFEKKALFKTLREANYSESVFRDLFRFLDEVLVIPGHLQQQFKRFVRQTSF